jgi:hypothetical protein
VIATGGEGEAGEKVNLKICLVGELNPGLQHERREHSPLYQGRLIRIHRNISLHILCISIFSILFPFKAPSHQALGWGIWTNLIF